MTKTTKNRKAFFEQLGFLLGFFYVWKQTKLCSVVAMLLASAVRRQVADPLLGVADLMKVLWAEMATCQSWDLWKLLEHPGGRNATFSWKTAPVPAWMEKT